MTESKTKGITTRAQSLAPVELKTSQELLGYCQDHFCRNGRVILYLDNKIVWGYFQDSAFRFAEQEDFDPVNLQKLRLYDREGEFLIWRVEPGIFRARLRDDTSGGKCLVHDSFPLLAGSSIDDAGRGFQLVREDRGVRFHLPLEESSCIGDLRLHLRYYLDFQEHSDQAEYVDVRFVEVVEGSESEKE